MSEAPERIRIDRTGDDPCWYGNPENWEEGDIEYVRADLYAKLEVAEAKQAEKLAALEQERDEALLQVEAVAVADEVDTESVAKPLASLLIERHRLTNELARLREAVREIKARAESGRAEANVEGEWWSNDHFGVIENMCEAALAAEQEEP